MNIAECDILRLVARFPPFRKLEIKGFPNLIFPVPVTSPSITELDVFVAGRLDILPLLQYFPRLRSMIIRNAELVAYNMHSIYQSPSVESIRLFNTTGEDWMEDVFFPSLTTVFYDTASETFCTFLSRHPLVTELGLRLHWDTIISLAPVAARLEKLHVVPPLEALYHLSEGSSRMPFPSLKSLTVQALTPPNNLTLADFEAVVRARCLPMRHPKNQATQPSFIVSAFTIVTTESAAAGLHLEWHGSDLYKESTKKIDEIGVYLNQHKVYLSWPEWE